MLKKILILGATGGIGSAIAHSLAEKNNLLLHGSNREKLEILKSQLNTTHNQIDCFVSDFSKKSEIKNLADELNKSDENIDWIINSAGYINEKEPMGDTEYSKLEVSYNVNAIAPIYISQTLQNKIVNDGGLIMISSTASLWNNPRFPIYASSKAALNTYTLAIAQQFIDTSKKALVICPGGTNTEMREKIANDAENMQSPDTIADEIKKIIDNKCRWSNGDIVIIKEGRSSLYEPSN